jgi:hypothetical protein
MRSRLRIYELPKRRRGARFAGDARATMPARVVASIASD